MKTLTLVRHAKAVPHDEAPDFERALNERGRRDAVAMGERLCKAGIRPQRLITSPALRAITTAQAFAETFGIPLRDLRIEPAIYEAEAKDLLDIVRELPPNESDVMLFGHNPGITLAALALADCPFDDLPTCGVVRLELELKAWSELKAECGRVVLYEHPKK